MSDTAVQQKQDIKAFARDLDRRGGELIDDFLRSSMQIALWIEEVCANEIWGVLGFETENDYRDSKGVGRSTWYRLRRIRENLKKMPRQRFLKLTAENAEHLIKLSERERYSEQWYEKALSLREHEFEPLVEKAIKEGAGDKLYEARVWMKIRLYESQKKVIEEALEMFATENNLDPNDRGRCLELLVVDYMNSGIDVEN